MGEEPARCGSAIAGIVVPASVLVLLMPAAISAH
jgi:hypothetical protein